MSNVNRPLTFQPETSPGAHLTGKAPLVLLLLLAAMAGLPAAPVVSGLNCVQRADASKAVDIYYDLANDLPVTVTLLASDDDGASWGLSCNLVSGDVGSDISPGAGKHIVWDVLTEHPNLSGNQYRVQVIADDGASPPIPADFILVEGGTFYPHMDYAVTLSSFYLTRYELTQSEYQAVMGVNPAASYGVGDNYPVYYVSWLKAIEYCNRRSITEGLTPCYNFTTYGHPSIDYGTDPDDWPSGWETWEGYSRHCVSCAWSAVGYRLPTEMEWTFAALGGNLSQGYNYSGSNVVGDVAWYYNNAGISTHPVGTKAPNELGFYDMSGNVNELVWDIYGDIPYAGEATNPTGPEEVYPYPIVIRGGGWGTQLYYMSIMLSRWSVQATLNGHMTGFRLCRMVP